MLGNGHPLKNRDPLIMLGILAFFLLWCVLSYSAALSPVLLPTPTMVFTECLRLFQKGILLRFTMESVARVAFGWTAAALVAVPIGLIIGASRRAAALFQPAFIFARYLPLAALLPLTILYLGTGNLQKCAVVFLGAFFQLTLMVAANVRDVPTDYMRAAMSLGTNRLELFTRILTPAALPAIMNSLRVSISWAWAFLVIAELVAADSGLGFMILDAQRHAATDRIFGGLIIIALLGILTDFLFRMLTDLLIHWKAHDS